MPDPSGPRVLLAVLSLTLPAAAPAAGPVVAAPAPGAGVVPAGPAAPPPPDGPAPPDARSPYAPPVDAPVVDPFREPAGPFGPGNRGLEYRTAPGSPARAIGDGVVAFAGAVAGRLVVSVVHPDGLRSALTGLAGVTVRVGDRVRQGDPLGVTAGRLHLGVRRAERYLDPAGLFAARRPTRTVLVPVPSDA